MVKYVDLPRKSNYSNPTAIRGQKIKKPDYLFGNPAFQTSQRFRCMQRQQFTNFGTVVFRPPITRSLAFSKSDLRFMRKTSKPISGWKSTGKCGAVKRHFNTLMGNDVFSAEPKKIITCPT